MKSVVYVKFPKTGLGNMLLVWANAAVFAHMNQLQLQTSRWWSLHWGAWWRRESKKRFYFSYFKEAGFAKRAQFTLQYFYRKVVLNPLLEKLTAGESGSCSLYIFNKLVTHEQMFLKLAPHKEMLSVSLLAMLREDKKKQLESYKVPEMSVHIRRGDFITTGQATSLDFFITGIRETRKALGRDVPVTVFTDAAPHELVALFELPAIRMAEPKADILDIVLMSKSRILMLSQSSSFSYWAAFLSDAVVIMKHDDWQERIKPDNADYHEIRWDMNKDSLSGILQEILLQHPLQDFHS